MRILLQRVSAASVRIDTGVIGEIGCGLVLLTGFGRDDEPAVLERAATRILNLRVFPDRDQRLQHSVRDIGGAVLAVPQFTLYARTDRGRRPDFTDSMPPDQARIMFDKFVEVLERDHDTVRSGRFGAQMAVSLVNDGPFTLHLQW
jgi:D-aminoacyl-tRNA deacylase